MLNLYRYQNADSEDVKLANKDNVEVFSDGMWVAPTLNNPDVWDVIATGANNDPRARLARMIFMEAGRSDARATGKMTTVVGDGVRGKTDQFIGTASQLLPGVQLSLITVTQALVNTTPAYAPLLGRMVLQPAAVDDVIKAIVVKGPNATNNPYLYFEFRNQN